MATLDEKEYSTDFSGLTSTAITAVVFLSAGIILEETLKRLRRYPAEDVARAAGKKVRERGMEAWAMGYLYRARTFVQPAPTTPDYSNWVLGWVWPAIVMKEKFFETHVGADATVYVRFLRGVFWWLLLMLCTVFPTLTSINFIYSPDTVSTLSIDRASISSLIKSVNGTSLLWVHVICIWFISISWMVVLTWIGYGAVRIRRNVLRSLLANSLSPSQSRNSHETRLQIQNEPDAQPSDPSISSSDKGWRFRTVLVRNIPESMRSEEAIRDYFEWHLRAGENTSNSPPGSPPNGVTSPIEKPPKAPSPAISTKPFPDLSLNVKSSSRRPLISAIVIVRKQGELNEQWAKYIEVQCQLEAAHVALAQNVANWVKAKLKAIQKAELAANRLAESGKLETSPKEVDIKKLRPFWRFWETKTEKEQRKLEEDAEKNSREGDDTIVDALREFVEGDVIESLDEKTGETRSIWTALHDLEPALLDRFQPLFKLKHFRGQAVPSIDYFLTKLNLLQRLIEDHRSNIEVDQVASTAFVTFDSVADARRARIELRSRPGGKVWGGRALECQVRWAPEFRDLDWPRLAHVSLSTDIVRGIVLHTIIWAATIFWVIPISFLIGLLSLSSLAKYIPALANYLVNHAAAESLFSNLLPTSIVALLGMLVPTLIAMLTRSGQTFITVSRLNREVQARYWKWAMCNIVIVFCIGITAFTAFLNAFKQPGSVLKVIADAFPKGATFFVSWSLLVIGVHHGIEHALFGIPFINHASIRKLKSPRKRMEESQPRFFSYHYWLPNHLLVVAVTFIFSILNPMVIPFNFVYFCFAVTVFKNQIAHVYWRRNYESNGRHIYTRAFRYSLDALILGQIVSVAFLEVLKLYGLGAACIPLIPVTAFVKLTGTRYFNLLMDEIDEAEASIACGESFSEDELSVPLTEQDVNFHINWRETPATIKTFAKRTLPALTLHPKQRLPVIPSPSHLPSHPRLRSGSEHRQGRRFGSQPRSPTSLEAVRPILREMASRESSNGSHGEPYDNGAGVTSHAIAAAPTQATIESELAFPTIAPKRLLTPHPAVLRDDRPVSHLHYDNPAVITPLAKSLWLPANPLIPVDLGDTVEYHGRALVSSEGGRGIVGSWDAEITAAEAGGQTTIGQLSRRQLSQSADESHGRHGGSYFSSTSRIFSTHRPLAGTERIRVASDVAARAELADDFPVPFEKKRRATGASSSGGSVLARPFSGPGSTDGSIWLSASPRASPSLSPPQNSPSLHRHPLENRPSPPAIPSFDRASSALSAPLDATFTTPTSALSESPAEGGEFDFPPRPATRQASDSALSVTMRASGRERRSPSLALSYRGRMASPGPLSPSGQSHPMEDHQEILEVSQSQAMMSELLEEERLAHERRLQLHAKRLEQERKDTQGGWLARTFATTGIAEAEADNAALPR